MTASTSTGWRGTGGGGGGACCATRESCATGCRSTRRSRTRDGAAPCATGASVTEEPWPGYKVSTAAYVISLLRPEVARDLELKRHGLVVYPQDPAYFQPYPDGRYLMIWNDPEKTREAIRKFSGRDADRYEEYERTLNRLAEFVEPP